MLGIVPAYAKDGKVVETFLSEDESDESRKKQSGSEGATTPVSKQPVSRYSSSGEMKPSFIKRFSSFRRSDKSSKSSTSLLGKGSKHPASHSVRPATGSGSKSSMSLPAKYIQATTVRKATLNPVWGERFRFELDDIETDTLHIDIWDHDDEVNVLEAVKKLNEVKGLKGEPPAGQLTASAGSCSLWLLLNA